MTAKVNPRRILRNRAIKRFTPVIRELPVECTLPVAFDLLAGLPHCLVLESSLPNQRLGRFAYLTADPVNWFTSESPNSASWGQLKNILQAHATESIPNLPDFQGGLAGFLGYELGQAFEKLPTPLFDPLGLPSFAFGLFDFVLAWDRLENRGWLISQGLPEVAPTARLQKAHVRADQIESLLAMPCMPEESASPASSSGSNDGFAPQYAVQQLDGLTSNFDRTRYLQSVEKAIEFIRRGDIFQVNLSQQLRMPANCSARRLYHKLRHSNPSTFGGYFDLGSRQVVSASPERLVAGRGGRIESRPIKGTRRRTGMPLVDLAAAEELKSSRKDMAENAMIVDLIRNDFSKVCEDHSILVSQFCELENYESVMHLVSAIEGIMLPGINVWDVLESIFPGGSVTGCPKIRAMQIITELEQSARGAYCGSLGYLSLDGTFDFNLLIRTVTAGLGWWVFPVGGAIVADSDPAQEYEETWIKAAGLLNACASQLEAQRGKALVGR